MLTTAGTYAALGGNNTSYVTNVYQALFGRAPTTAELNYQVNALSKGTTLYQFVTGMQDLVEGLRTRVARWYIDDMAAPESLSALKSAPGVEAWANLLASGWSDESVLTAMLSSPARYDGLGGTNSDFVSALYYEVLGRGSGRVRFGVSPERNEQRNDGGEGSRELPRFARGASRDGRAAVSKRSRLDLYHRRPLILQRCPVLGSPSWEVIEATRRESHFLAREVS